MRKVLLSKYSFLVNLSSLVRPLKKRHPREVDYCYHDDRLIKQTSRHFFVVAWK